MHSTGLSRSLGRWRALFAAFAALSPLIFFAFSGRCASQAAPQTGTPPTRRQVADFQDVGERAGLKFEIVSGDKQTKKYIIETTGTGVAIFDYDNDGWPDIFIVNGTTLGPQAGQASPTNHLFHNNHDGTFTDVTDEAGLRSSGWGQGVCAGDYDNDGFEDLYVTYYGKNRLYHNEGNGTFKEAAETAGVSGNGKQWGTGCAFVDYDRDGLLDIMVANYVDFDLATTPAPGQGTSCMWKGVAVMCGPRGLKSTPNVLYHNLGHGKFEDVSKKSGIEKTSGHYCFSVSTLDFDDDGWPDIYVACDSTPSILYHNNRDGTFADVAVVAGAAFNEDGREQAGMGSTVADYDGDGRLDIFKTNFSDDSSTLYHNNGDGTFTDATYTAGLGLHTQYLGWGTMFFDFDNDGWPDLLLVNGHVYPEVDKYTLGSEYQEPRILYRNTGKGTFEDVSSQAGPAITRKASGRGLAIGDLWNNGKLSAVITNMGEAPSLLVNEMSYPNHWIAVRTIGTKSNRDGIGAKITIKAGGRVFVNEVRSGSSYSSSNDMRLHFGLGSAAKIDSLEVRWPTGAVESFDAKLDAINSIKEGTGKALKAAAAH
ncbi:MAG: CRTAC1 family protein [Acidobacteria bacterium]|nr:CRTAC1 family protein [Acidobacteriota bacterium]